MQIQPSASHPFLAGNLFQSNFFLLIKIFPPLATLREYLFCSNRHFRQGFRFPDKHDA